MSDWTPTTGAPSPRHGVMFAPGILLDGEMFSYGRLSERRLRRRLARHPAIHDTASPHAGRGDVEENRR